MQTDSPVTDLLRGAKILIAEDDNETREVMKFTLEALGCVVIEAADGREAQAQAVTELPDIIVSDVMMPNMTGIEFVSWLRSEIHDRFVPVLLVSALSEIDDRVEGLQAGADDYLSKPFHARELQARVQALFRIKVLTEKLRLRSEEVRAANDALIKAQEALLAKERELVAAQISGAAAHNLGQPLTTILLQCHLLEKSLSRVAGGVAEDVTALRSEASQVLSSIRRECELIRGILSQLKQADPARTQPYLGEVRITELSNADASVRTVPKKT